MIEAKSKFFVQRLFATHLERNDWYKAVLYNSYRGDINRIPFWYVKHLDSHSCQTDLSLDIDEIMKRMTKHLQKDIRKAEEMGCIFEYGDFYEEFIHFYRKFAYKKGINSPVSIDRIKRYGETIVTKATYEGRVLAMHIRVIDRDNKLAFGLYSANARFDADVNPQIAGRANKFLQYKDLELLKNIGILTYDWSGVDINPNHKDRYSIGEYKLAYGATVVPSPTIYTPLYMVEVVLRNLAVNLLACFRKKPRTTK